MKPYYSDSLVTLYHGDCREILPTLANESIDLCLTDPPYIGLKGGYAYNAMVNPVKGFGVSNAVRWFESVGDPWEASLDWCPQVARVAKLGIMVFCTYHSVPEIAEQFKALRRVMLLTWYKRNSPPTGSNVPRFTSEFIWCFALRPGLKWDAFDSTVIDIPKLTGGCMATERLQDADGASLHPTQKPLALMTRLVVGGADTILDPFAGSGTTLIAAILDGRKAIGIEIEERYCEIAARRLSQGVLCFATEGMGK